MTSQPTTPKRWRPRFSVRTLVVLVTLVCCYAACWGPTKKQGVRDVASLPAGRVARGTVQPIAPLLVFAEDEPTPDFSRMASGPWLHQGRYYHDPRRQYFYFWFFGYIAKLPYEREIPDQPAVEAWPTKQ